MHAVVGAPGRYRPIVPILGSLGIYVDYATGGGPGFPDDAVHDPRAVAMGSVWRSYRAIERPLIGPIALGLACTFKQSAWFIAADARDRHHDREPECGSGLAPDRALPCLAAIAFLVPNLPFILAGSARLGRWRVPAVPEPLVPFGQGFIAISTTFFQGGGAPARVYGRRRRGHGGDHPRLCRLVRPAEAVAAGPAARRPAAPNEVTEQLLRRTPSPGCSWPSRRSGRRRPIPGLTFASRDARQGSLPAWRAHSGWPRCRWRS